MVSTQDDGPGRPAPRRRRTFPALFVWALIAVLVGVAAVIGPAYLDRPSQRQPCGPEGGLNRLRAATLGR